LSQAPPTPVFRTDINFVRVDVIVSDKQGAAVENLRQQDFEVTEDGKAQAIQTFKLINVKDATQTTAVEPPRQIRDPIQEQAEAQREDTRLFGIFLDDYLPQITQQAPLTAAGGFVRNDPAPP